MGWGCPAQTTRFFSRDLSYVKDECKFWPEETAPIRFIVAPTAPEYFQPASLDDQDNNPNQAGFAVQMPSYISG